MTHVAHRLLLRLYPDRLRDELGDEIEAVFAARLAAARRRGSLAVARLLLLEIRDSVRTGLRARWSSPAGLPPARPPHSPRERALQMLDGILNDLRAALRLFVTAPAFAFAAVVMLAVAIGANTAMFSVIDAVLLRPLPMAAPDRLVSIYETNPERGWTRAQVAAANYLDWRERTSMFDGIAAHNDWLIERTWLRDGEPRVFKVNEVTGNFFEVLGAELAAGRGLEPGDDWQGGEKKVVLSHAAWTEHFGGSPSVVGQSILLDDEAHTVVGVAGPGFRHPFAEADGWVPMGWNPDNRAAVWFRRAHGMRAIGRLAPGVAPEAAAADLAAVAGQLQTEYPETNVAMGTGLVSLHEWISGDTRGSLSMLFGAVGFVLLIACVNVANLQLARFADRRVEIALRGALGAGRLRLLRQHLLESLTLALVAGALGVGLAVMGIRGIVGMLPADFPRVADVGLDWRVLLFSFGAATLTGILFGLGPSLRASRHEPVDDLRGGRQTEGRRQGRAAAWLVAVEVALVLPVAVAAVLMLQTLDNVSSVDPGFRTEDTVVFGIALPRTQYADGNARNAFFMPLLDALRADARIDNVALSTRLPFVQQRWSSDFRAESWGPDEYGVGVRHDEISRELFETMGVPFVDGRDFEAAEINTETVAIVNRALAEQYFPEGDAVGQRLCFDRAAEDCQWWYRVVGVVDNVRRVSLRAAEEPSIYGSWLQNGSSSGYLVVHSELPTATVVEKVTAAVRKLDPAIPFHTVTTMEQVVADSVGRERLVLALLSAFAAIAVLLAAFGVYSVVAAATVRRTREIGVRMALGARATEVLRAVVRRGLAPVAVGLALGVALSLGAASSLRELVFGVGVRDPLSYGAVAALVICVAAVACLIPGRRATRVNPVDALRAE